MINAVSHGASGFEASKKPTSSRGGAAPAQSLGAVLRQRREAMGVSLAEVELATRIRQKYLAAIEADEWHLLPGEVVGRGFLRNYSEYLGLEAHEVVDRRRAVTDPGLVAALSTTSSGAALPPERQVDYRPKEVELKDEAEPIQRGDIKLTPVISIIAVALVVVFGWWLTTRMRGPAGEAYAAVQSQIERVTSRDEPTATPALIGIVNTQNTDTVAATTEALDSGGAVDSAGPPPATDDGSNSGSEAAAPAAIILAPTNTPTTSVADTPTTEPPTVTPEPPVDTPTPEPPPPTPTFTPVPPTPEPEIPTDTPTPEPPSIVAAACADGRSVITSPGMGQVVSGVLSISGSALHDNLDYYKLEFAPGENPSDGYVYFDGRSSGVAGGPLGSIDTRNLPNGVYTLRVTVVDQTGNFPAPCLVTVTVQN